MARERLCKICGGWHRLDAWPHNCAPARTARSRLSAPMLALDTMDPIKSMLDGRMYTSKAALRQSYRDGGVEEVGNDPSVLDPKPWTPPKEVKDRRRKEIEAAVGSAISQAGLGV